MRICQADFEISFLIVVNRRDFLLGLAILLCYNMAMTPLSDTILSAKKKLLEADPKLLEAAGLTTEQRNDLLNTEFVVKPTKKGFISISPDAYRCKVNFNENLEKILPKDEKTNKALETFILHEMYHVAAYNFAMQKIGRTIPYITKHLIAEMTRKTTAIPLVLGSGLAIGSTGLPWPIALIGGFIATRAMTTPMRKEEKAADRMANILSTTTVSAATNHILSSLQDNADTSTKKPFKDRAERLWWDIKQFTLDPGHLTSYSRKKQSNKDAKDRKTLITAQPT